MADPLSIAASVMGLLAVGTAVSKTVFQIVNDTRSAPFVIRSLSQELEGLCKGLGSLAAMLDGGVLPSWQNFPAIELSELLGNIMEDFKSLQTILGEYRVTPSDGVLRQRWKQLLWVFRESDVDDLKKSIEAYKATLGLTMTASLISGMSNISRTTEQIRDQFAQLQMEVRELRALCKDLKSRGGRSSASSLHTLSALGGSSTSIHRVTTTTSTASIDSVASTYRAASFIEYYCNGLESAYSLPINAPTPPPEEVSAEPISDVDVSVFAHPPTQPLEDLFPESMSGMDVVDPRIMFHTLEPDARDNRRQPFYIHTVVRGGKATRYFRIGQAPAETTTRIGIDGIPKWYSELVDDDLSLPDVREY